MNDFLASCLYMDGSVIDEICDDFNVDICEEDVFDLLKESHNDYKEFGRHLLVMLLERIIRLYYSFLNEERFGYDVSSPSNPCFYYARKPFRTKAELDAIVSSLEQ